MCSIIFLTYVWQSCSLEKINIDSNFPGSNVLILPYLDHLSTEKIAGMVRGEIGRGQVIKFTLENKEYLKKNHYF